MLPRRQQEAGEPMMLAEELLRGMRDSTVRLAAVLLAVRPAED